MLGGGGGVKPYIGWVGIQNGRGEWAKLYMGGGGGKTKMGGYGLLGRMGQTLYQIEKCPTGKKKLICFSPHLVKDGK